MRLLRAALILSVVLLAFALLAVTLRWPVPALLIGIVVVARRRKAWVSDACGTARWADPATDLAHLIEEERHD